MDYTNTYHIIKQSPDLRYRQMVAFQNFAPQTDAGSVIEAFADGAEAAQEQGPVVDFSFKGSGS